MTGTVSVTVVVVVIVDSVSTEVAMQEQADDNLAGFDLQPTAKAEGIVGAGP